MSTDQTPTTDPYVLRHNAVEYTGNLQVEHPESQQVKK